jgi:hypothetical protein
MAKPKSRVGEALYILWEDAWANHGYETPESIKDSGPYLVEMVGICIRDDSSGITLAVEKMPDGRYRHIHHQPLAMIRKVKVLTDASNRKTR